MRDLLHLLWHDDDGAVVSVEILLIVSILIFGLIPGFVALRNSMNAAMTSLGNLIVTLIPSFTFSGFAITGTDGMGNPITIFQVDGFQFTPNVSTLSADQVAPIVIPPEVIVPPAP
jgi:ribose/xylose/arabinose/galactoside ABC-type transport system permease subunit